MKAKEKAFSIKLAVRQLAGKPVKQVGGIDANVLVDLIRDETFYLVVRPLLNKPHLLYTHELCLPETINTLVKKYKFKESVAKAEFRKLQNDLKIDVVPLNKANSELAEDVLKEAVKRGITLHEPDNQMLVDFVKASINIIFSENHHVVATCKKILNLAVKEIPPVSKAQQWMIKDFFKSYKQKRRR